MAAPLYDLLPAYEAPGDEPLSRFLDYVDR
jgi:hypothetical protein